MVVKLVIMIGRIRVAPASISAFFSGISIRYWFTVSTYRIPLFTTVPTRIKNPRMEVMDMLTPVSFRSPKEPTRLNGIVVMTMKENFGDSNCADITTKIRNTATAIALYSPENSSCIIRSLELVPRVMVPVKFGLMTSLSIWVFTAALEALST